MSRYIRHQSVISKQSDEGQSEDHWLQQFEKSLLKDAVQPREQKSLFDQINSIMNTKSKYPSVEAAVQDMQERSGLLAYRKNINKSSVENAADAVATKVAAADDQSAFDKTVNMTPVKNMTPTVIQKCPQIANTLDNYIRDTKGNLPVPAIIEKLKSIHQTDVPESKDWDDDKLIILVSKLNLAAKRDNPHSYEHYNNLGARDPGTNTEVDPSISDAFFGLMPAK